MSRNKFDKYMQDCDSENAKAFMREILRLKRYSMLTRRVNVWMLIISKLFYKFKHSIIIPASYFAEVDMLLIQFICHSSNQSVHSNIKN